VLALHVSTATATGPAAPTKGLKRSKSAWRDDKKPFTWVSQAALGKKNLRALGLLVVQRSEKARGSAGHDHFWGGNFKKSKPPFKGRLSIFSIFDKWH